VGSAPRQGGRRHPSLPYCPGLEGARGVARGGGAVEASGVSERRHGARSEQARALGYTLGGGAVAFKLDERKP
jgi:hypothetical protein